MQKVLFFLISVLFLTTATAADAAGQYGCQVQYGVETCGTIQVATINKLVKHPTTGEFVDNLGTNDPKYAPEAIIPFQIIIKNTSSEVLKNLKIKDTLPQYTVFDSGAGSYDSKANTLEISIDSLNPDESKTFTFQVKSVKNDNLPQNTGVVCVVNKAQLILSETKGGTEEVVAEDNSQACIQKPILGSTTKGGLKVFPQPKTETTPPTGPEMLALLPLLSGGLLGVALRKLSTKSK